MAAPPDVVPVSQNFFLWLFTELFRIFGMRGEYMCFDMNPFASPLGHDYSRGILEQLYKACVIAGPLSIHDTSIQRIARSGIPYMALGRLDSIRDISCATVDYEQGAYMSTRFLLNRGHRRIAMLKAFAGFQPGVERRRGYTRALEEAGIPVQEELIRATNFGGADIARFTHRLLRDSNVTALIDCSATEDGNSLREGARRAGRTIGKDLDVVVWTYAENGAVLPEAAAHVWLPVREAAAEGLEQLAAWLAEEREGPIRLVYQPVLNQDVNGREVPKPRRLFLTNEEE